jgi:hypothetical protein
MAYDPSDLRSQLSTTATALRTPGANVAPQYFEFDRMAPTEASEAGSQSWWVRGQACIVNYANVGAGDTLSRAGQLDEYVILIHDRQASVTLQAGEEQVEARGRLLVVMPPGDSSVTPSTATAMVRLFTTQSPELCALCDNDGFYATPDPNVAPFQPWPDPPAGHRIRVYELDQVADDPDRFGRLYRCSTFMVNYFSIVDGPRNPAKLSPHHHDDFEQLSLQFEGDYVHHLRTPWVPDMGQWRDDEHQHCASPSVTVIPPPSVHTSQAVGEMPHQLVDVFCPPRFDFSARPGWVLNADEYPEPAAASASGDGG